MHLLKINIPVLCWHLQNGLIRFSSPLWPEIKGFADSVSYIKDRLHDYVQNVVLYQFPQLFTNITSISPESLFLRHFPSKFVTLSVRCVLNDNNELNNIPFPVDILVWKKEEMYYSWVPIFNTCFEIPKSQKWLQNPEVHKFLDSDSSSETTESQERTVLSIQSDSEITSFFQKQVNKVFHKINTTYRNLLIIQNSDIQSTKVIIIPMELSIPSGTELLKQMAENVNLEDNLANQFEKFNLNISDSQVGSSIVGMDKKVEELCDSLFLPQAQSILLIGEPGVGKTALWQKFVHKLNKIQKEGIKYLYHGKFFLPTGNTIPAGASSQPLYEEDKINCLEMSLTTLLSSNETPIATNCEKFVQFAERSHAIIHLNNLWELDQLGKSIGHNESYADLLVPYIQRGQIVLVTECNQEQYSELTYRNPGILEPFTKIFLLPPEKNELHKILKSKIASINYPKFKSDALRKIELLFNRYSLYSAQPGAALLFLHQLIDEWNNQRAITGKDILTKFSKQTGLPLFILDNTVSFPEEETRQFFAKRIMGQGEEDLYQEEKSVSVEQTGKDSPPHLSVKTASSKTISDTVISDTVISDTVASDTVASDTVTSDTTISTPTVSEKNTTRIQNLSPITTVINLIKTIHAGLSKPNKPLASLLFIGPTGTGKTELAKALAEYFYGDPHRMIRIDMNEYSSPASAVRLIEGTYAQEGVLTTKIRTQPFGIVLLDEFEKANPAVFDLLLQVLGEGRLTDSCGRLADFRNSIIILTSNLGVDTAEKRTLSFQSSSSASQDAKKSAQEVEHYLEQVRNFIRPELMNRIDAVVPFHSLSKETLRRILFKELDQLDKRMGILCHRLFLSYEPDVYDFLVQKGYNPKYGARPLRRALEKYLLVPLADALSQYSNDIPLTANFFMRDNSVQVSLKKLSEKNFNKQNESKKESETPSDFVPQNKKPGTDLSLSLIQQRKLLASDGPAQLRTCLRRQLSRVNNSEIFTQFRYESFLYYKKKNFQKEQQKVTGYDWKIENENREEDQYYATVTSILEDFEKLLHTVSYEEEAILTSVYSRKVPPEFPTDHTLEYNELMYKCWNLLKKDNKESVYLFFLSFHPELTERLVYLYQQLAMMRNSKTKCWKLNFLRTNATYSETEIYSILDAVIDPFPIVNIQKKSQKVEVLSFSQLLSQLAKKDSRLKQCIYGAPYIPSWNQSSEIKEETFGFILKISQGDYISLFDKTGIIQCQGVKKRGTVKKTIAASITAFSESELQLDTKKADSKMNFPSFSMMQENTELKMNTLFSLSFNLSNLLQLPQDETLSWINNNGEQTDSICFTKDELLEQLSKSFEVWRMEEMKGLFLL